MNAQPPRKVGRLWLDREKQVWNMTCEPHVAMMAKRIFRRIPANRHGVYTLSHTPSVCRDLEWFATRYPLDIEDYRELASSSEQHREHIASLDELFDPNYVPPELQLEIPARPYQRLAADLFLRQGSLLLADEVGLGKTVSSIAALTDSSCLPAVIVCLPHLQKQWFREIQKFTGGIRAHIIKKQKNYSLAGVSTGDYPAIIIITYNKLSAWADVLSNCARSIVFDEVQELRRSESLKYSAAKHIAHSPHVQRRLGLSATPIYNFGGEIFNVMEVLFPGVLGTQSEFYQEWCYDKGRHATLKAPHAFGSWLKENHYILRRTRADVGRELPKLTKITQPVDCDTAPLEDIKSAAGELARIILSDQKQVDGDKMRAAEEFSMILRQATGIAKAPHVAAFVEMLIESGERVVLFGWHRAVYEIWADKLAHRNPVFYTGKESGTQKDASVKAFLNRETDLIVISLRSGAGLDGLQFGCRTTVHGELDWSPAVHEQNIGRVFRDGQADPVMSYFMLSEGGVDPLMAETLGLKSEQVDGIRGQDRPIVERKPSAAGLRKLAQHFLKRSR